MRDKFFEILTKRAKKNKKIILLVADVGFGVVNDFKKINPNQFFNVGISEQNMAGLAAGLALAGKKVFCYSIANFATLRSIEHIRNGACYHNLDIKFVSGGSGYSYGSLGYSHHAIEDLGIMRCLPNIDIFSPSSDYEIEYIADFLTLNHKTPAYLRIDKTKILEPNPKKKIKNLTKPRLIIKNNKKESEIAIFSSGGIIQEVKKATEKANNLNISCSVYSIFNISKLDKNFSKKFKNKKIIVVEETIKENGIYIFLKENLNKKNIISSISINKNSIYFNAGSQTFIRKKQKISENYILKKIIDISKLKL